jgi:multicomponent Na+:H+ antiporter subunit D
LEATAQWETRFVWTAITALGAALFVALALRPSLSAFRSAASPLKAGEAPFPMLLGASVAAFFCLSVGLAPGWLYGLMPSELQFQPFSLDRLAPQLELLGASGLVMLGAWVLKLAPGARPLRLLDVDSLYRGPLAGAARWAGIVLLRLYGAVQNAGSAVTRGIARSLGAFARASDRPYDANAAAAIQLASFAILIVLLMVGRDS